jgi:hypothetical protein
MEKAKSSSHFELLLKHWLLPSLILYLISFLKSLHPPHGVNYPLFAGIERVAFATYLYSELWGSGTNGEGIAAKASHFSIIIILGMDLVFHL